jgi:ribosomal protein S18 acetylase RimI-like enzyme
MASVRILDVTDVARFERIPRCADAAFDHRTCDYWEDDAQGSKAHRSSWLRPGSPPPPPKPSLASNPFAPTAAAAFNPFDPGAARPAATRPDAARPDAAGPATLRPNPFEDADEGDDDEGDDANPFAPRRDLRPLVPLDAPRKLQLLGRGLAVFGSYAKVIEVDGEAAGYCQFGPLSAYPRAAHVRDLYPQLPSAPLPAVITCIATTAEARRQGHARALIAAVVDDLADRGFAAVEAYPEPEVDPDATSAANPAFWLACGFGVAVDDARFPVMRREL